MTQTRREKMTTVTHLINQSEFSAARAEFATINQVAPVAGEQQWIEGRIAYAQGQYADAEAKLVAAVQQNPSHYGIYFTLGNCLLDAGLEDAGRMCLIGSSFNDYINQRYFAAEIQKQAALAADASAQPVYLYKQAPVYFSDALSQCEQIRSEFSSPFIKPNTAGVCIIEQGKVWFDGHNLCVYDKNDRLIEECTRGNPYLIESIRHNREPQQLAQTLGIAIARSSSNYFHWTTDVMPGFHLLDRVAAQHNGIQHFLVSHQHKDFQRSFMELAGISLDSVITPDLDSGCYFAADKVIVPIFDHKMAMSLGQWAVDYLQQLADVATKQHSQQQPNLHRRIYISRRDVGQRAIENEEALISELQTLGFEDVTLDGMNVSEQMALFASCEMIVAPHGAGLTNTLYCAPGTTVIEFFGEFVQPCFRALAQLAALDYQQLSLVDREKDEMTKTRSKHANQQKSLVLSDAHIADIVQKVNIAQYTAPAKPVATGAL